MNKTTGPHSAAEAAAGSETVSFTGIHHVSVVVTDRERAAQFYGQVLGLRRINKPRTFTQDVVWFELGDQQVHLIVRDQPDSTSPRHMALHVPDAVQARDYFRRLNVPTAETTLIPGADRFFIHDPDGNRIECIQWLRPYSSEENAV